MRAPPPGLDVQELTRSLHADWDIDPASVAYAPVGGGSYHWIVDGADDRQYFATLDDLDRKPWLGSTRDSAFAGLREAFDAAAALRDGGLEYVVAPIRSSTGATVARVTSRYSLALFPFVPGRAGTFGRYDDGERAAILRMLERLHRAHAKVRPFDLELPGRHELDEALHALAGPWDGGPLSEATRSALAAHAEDVHRLLALHDRLAQELPPPSDWVVTHGEPHAGNVIGTEDGYVLVDWDTVALAPPARDLWMLTDEAGFFGLRWDLADLASFTAFLRAPHADDPDTRKAHEGVATILARAR